MLPVALRIVEAQGIELRGFAPILEHWNNGVLE